MMQPVSSPSVALAGSREGKAAAGAVVASAGSSSVMSGVASEVSSATAVEPKPPPAS